MTNDEHPESTPAEHDSTPPTSPQRPKARTLGIVGGGIAAAAVLLAAGVAIGDNNEPDSYLGMRSGYGQQAFPNGERSSGGPHGGGMGEGRGPGMRGGGMGEGDGPGMRGGGRQKGMRGGGMAVVTKVDDSTLTVTMLRSGTSTTVMVNDDTTYTTRGDNGENDIEDAQLSDIREGSIIMVRPTSDDAQDTEESDDEREEPSELTAKGIFLLYAGE
jgi:hypothetical protein